MIKKLRRKFILINMAFVASILVAVLAVFFSANVIRAKNMTDMTMMQALNRERFKKEAGKTEPGRRDQNGPSPMVPVFVLHIGDDGASVESITANDIEVSEELAAELAGTVLAKEEFRGVLKDYTLSYFKDISPQGIRLVFADQSFELSSLRSLLLGCLLLFFLAFFLFFFLSLFLSRWALKPVEEAWQQQSQFIADASHELKTPLTVILANLGILSSHKDSTIREQNKWLSNTTEEARRMKQLVEELLFLARSDAKSLPADSSAFTELDFSDLILNCALLFESVAFEQKVELTNDITSGILLTGNENQLKQMAAILLDNACKYAGSGGKAAINLKRTAHHAVLSVSNTGDPISPEVQKHMFERFYRSDESRVRQTGGYGLGLAIARTITEEHKGKIAVSSGPEQKTTFTVTLPAKAISE